MIDLNDLVLQNERLIYSIINKYKNYFDIEDLYQVGVIGLLNAYKNFNDDYKTKFTSYAYFYIKGEVNKYIRESNVLKFSRELIKINSLLEKAKGVLIQKLNRDPTTFELSLFLEIDESQIIDALNASSLVESLDNDEMLYNTLNYKETNYNEEILDLKNEIDKLDDFDKRIILSRYQDNLSQQEISQLLGINQTKVSRSEKQILIRLRKRLE